MMLQSAGSRRNNLDISSCHVFIILQSIYPRHWFIQQISQIFLHHFYLSLSFVRWMSENKNIFYLMWAIYSLLLGIKELMRVFLLISEICSRDTGRAALTLTGLSHTTAYKMRPQEFVKSLKKRWLQYYIYFSA